MVHEECSMALRQGLEALTVQICDRLDYALSILQQMREDLATPGREYSEALGSLFLLLDTTQSEVSNVIELTKSQSRVADAQNTLCDTSTHLSSAENVKSSIHGNSNNSKSMFVCNSHLFKVHEFLGISETLRSCLGTQGWAIQRLSKSRPKERWMSRASSHMQNKEWSDFRYYTRNPYRAPEISQGLEALIKKSYDIHSRGMVNNQNQGKSTKILSKHCSSQASDSSRFRYEPLNTEKHEIRVLKFIYNSEHNMLCGTLKHVSLADLFDYFALSYTWGGQEATEKIFLDGKALSITPNLASALRSTMIAGLGLNSKVIWVDAICINQEDIEERSQQVRRIPGIYGRAETIIWLGAEDKGSLEAVDLLQELGCRNYSLDDNVQRARLGSRLATVQQLLQRPWWNRLWIIQEYVLSGDPVILCGERSISFSDLIAAIDRLYNLIADKQLREESHSVNLLLKSRAVSRIMSLDYLNRMWRNNCSMAGPVDFLSVLSQSRSAFASDDKDKVYGVLGLAIDATKIIPHPDYNHTTEQLYTRLVKSHISYHRKIDIICHADNSRSQKTLPSWVPDWSDDLCPPSLTGFLWDDSLRIFRQTDFHAGGSRKFDIPPIFTDNDENMTVRGFHIGIIDAVSDDINGHSSPMKPQLSSHTGVYKSNQAILSAIVASLSARTEGLPDHARRAFKDNVEPSSQDGEAFNNALLDAEQPLPSWYQRNKQFSIFGRPLEAWICSRPDKEDLGIKSTNVPQDFQTSCEKTMAGRQLFTTENGYVGIARASVKLGDFVCVLPGCSVPVILRRNNWHFNFFGDCYVHGIMQGEFVSDMFRSDKYYLGLRSFVLV